MSQSKSNQFMEMISEYNPSHRNQLCQSFAEIQSRCVCKQCAKHLILEVCLQPSGVFCNKGCKNAWLEERIENTVWDENGWDENGWDENGWDENGWDENGWDENGWDENGLDENYWYNHDEENDALAFGDEYVQFLYKEFVAQQQKLDEDYDSDN